MTDLNNVLHYKFPNKEFVNRGGQIEWVDGTTVPTAQELSEWTTEYQSYYQLKIEYPNALKELFRVKANERDYDDEQSIVNYVSSTNPTWAQEAHDFIAWRDSCWNYAFDVQAQVEGGQMDAPSIEDFINNAPSLVWSE